MSCLWYPPGKISVNSPGGRGNVARTNAVLVSMSLHETPKEREGIDQYAYPSSIPTANGAPCGWSRYWRMR
jgi:hypothetical protein